VQPGQIIAAKYRVDRLLGEGAFGVVVAATHTQLGQRVALKFLQKDAARQPGVVERFLREAQAAVQIQSEHVARVIDVGTLDQGAPYMVMEFLQGRDLSQVLEAQGALPLQVALDYVLQASEALAEAHALGIVHRDLKPANLFLTARADGSPLVKVLDFGISKQLLSPGRGHAESLTRTHGMMGSPLYMAPEQGRSAKRVDARADIWSLGVILYELTTRQWPFFSENIAGLFGAISTAAPQPMSSVWPACPPAFEAVIQRCLEKEPSARFQSVAELAEALAPLAPASQLSVQRIVRLVGRPAGPPDASPVGPAGSPGGTLLLAPRVAKTALLDSGDRPTRVLPRPQTSPAARSLEPEPQEPEAPAEPVLEPHPGITLPLSPSPEVLRSTFEWGQSTGGPPTPPPRPSWHLGVAAIAVLLVGGLGGAALSSLRQGAGGSGSPGVSVPIPSTRTSDAPSQAPLASAPEGATSVAPPVASAPPTVSAPPAATSSPTASSVPATARTTSKGAPGPSKGRVLDWGPQH